MLRNDSVHFRPQAIFAIRDARGLKANEKAYLWSVESRGRSWTDHATASADIGISVATYYRIQTSLKARGLVKTSRRYNSTTFQQVDLDAVRALAPESRASVDHHDENADSQGETGDSHGAETKTTLKDTKKECLHAASMSAEDSEASPASDISGLDTWWPELFENFCQGMEKEFGVEVRRETLRQCWGPIVEQVPDQEAFTQLFQDFWRERRAQIKEAPSPIGYLATVFPAWVSELDCTSLGGAKDAVA